MQKAGAQAGLGMAAPPVQASHGLQAFRCVRRKHKVRSLHAKQRVVSDLEVVCGVCSVCTLGTAVGLKLQQTAA